MEWFWFALQLTAIGVFYLGMVLLGVWLGRQYDEWRTRRSGPPVAPADWLTVVQPGQDHVYYWETPEGRRSYQTDLDEAVTEAHTASLARGDWPSTATVWVQRKEHAVDRIVYGHCHDCGFATYRDVHSRCMPCHAAEIVSKSPLERRHLARKFSQTRYPQWFGPDVVDRGDPPLSTEKFGGFVARKRLDVPYHHYDETCEGYHSDRSGLYHLQNGPSFRTLGDMHAAGWDIAEWTCGFVPPTPGYAGCTRTKGHDGPCAHELSPASVDPDYARAFHSCAAARVFPQENSNANAQTTQASSPNQSPSTPPVLGGS